MPATLGTEFAMNYIKIERRAELRSYLKKFEEKGLHTIALDIEAESNLHVYGEKLCLVQIFDGVDSVIIDPFRIDSDTLKILFENTDILKVMYDAGSDLSLLKNTAGIEIKSILDLRPAVELLNYEKKDLHSVIAFELGIFLEKKRTYQKHNWTNRPLSKQAIDYALNDVIHLFTLKDVILAKLYAKKLFEPFLLKNLQIQNKDYTRNPEDRYRKINGYSGLETDKKTVFRRVFDIREKYAKQCNMPPHNVIHKADLINIVNDPKFIDKIRFSKKVGTGLVQDMVHELRMAVEAV
jgi:ribonuclease D